MASNRCVEYEIALNEKSGERTDSDAEETRDFWKKKTEMKKVDEEYKSKRKEIWGVALLIKHVRLLLEGR